MSANDTTRKSSKSPSDGTKQNGGVALPNVKGLYEYGSHENKKNIRVALPNVNPQKLAEEERERNQKKYAPYNGNKVSIQSNGSMNMKLNVGAQPFKPGSNKPFPIELLNKNSTADEPEPKSEPAPIQPVIVTSDTTGKGKALVQHPIGTRGSMELMPVTEQVYYTTDVGPIPFQGSHYLKIEGLTAKDVAKWGDIMSDCDIEPMLRGMKSIAAADQITYLCCFDDVRSTDEVKDFIEQAQMNDWQTKYISQTEYAGGPDGEGSKEKTTYFDGQVVFVASFTGPTTMFKPDLANPTVHKLAESFGEMRAFTQVQSAAWPNLEFRAEYYMISVAKKALETATKTSPHVMDNWKVIATELAEGSQSPAEAAVFNGMGGVRIVGTPPNDGENKIIAEFASPTGRTTWVVDKNGNRVPGKPLRVCPKVGSIPFGVSIAQWCTPTQRDRYYSEPSTNAPNQYNSTPRNNSWGGYGGNNNYSGGRQYNGHSYSRSSPKDRNIPGPQTVEIWKIENGQDVRTTIMLRNIPNKLTCFDLKEVLDEYCWGNYDFSYLRVDFEKNTNVGYAFVNFYEPANIVPFVQFKAGKRWVRDNPRLVELSYATVQGYDCLVEKFRNSAIMSEFPEFRPKLWWTFMNAPEDKLVGEEQDFPPPNNLTKKQRSLDNAAHIGLYAPRTNHISRQRGRHSQWDRGTNAHFHEQSQQYQQSPMMQSPMMNGHYSDGSQGSNGYEYGAGYSPNGYQGGYNGGYNNGYNNGYQPRFVAPPPQFPVQPGMYQNGMMQQPYGYGNGYEQGTDVFGPNNANGYHQGGFQQNDFGNGYQSNGYNGYQGQQNGGRPFGTGPNTPASRLRTHTNGRLGGRSRQVTVASPGAAPLPQVNEESSTDGHFANPNDGFNNKAGPFFCPEY